MSGRRAVLAALAAGLVLGTAGACGEDGAGQRGRAAPAGPAPGAPPVEWTAYGGDARGQRWSPLADITPANVAGLQVAWIYHTGDVSDGKGEVRSTTAFEDTPLLVDGTLYVCTPFNRVIALDPATGAERWTFDPDLDLSGRYSNQLVCRGLSTWLDARREPGAACRRRIFTATNDARLIALDAADGAPCADFGRGGQVDLAHDVGETHWHGEYQVTSPPALAGDLVIVGSAISDNDRVDAPSGVVRAFDARTGALRWAWDLAPPSRAGEPGYVLGTPNVWAPMAVDARRDLLFVPTGNPSPDYYRGGRPDADYYGSSVVALRASTGEVVWRFQTVHHDLWDYDVPAQPSLIDLHRDGRSVPALVQPTKMGHLFVLQRETGQPLFPVEERPVPQGGAPGEQLSPTQPFPVKPPPLVRSRLSTDDAWGLTPWDRGWCRRKIASLDHGSIFTPPSERGTIAYPGNAGGSNWGGVAVDPERQLAVANLSELAFVVRLIPRDRFDAERAAHPGVEMAPQTGTPFGLLREPFLSPLGLPCTTPPWGVLAAVDLATGDLLWKIPFGGVRDISPIPIPWEPGVPNVGGPLLTASGLVFIGAAMDDYLRAYDVASGRELWRGRLPAGGQATPMTFRARPGGRQLVVIAAGGHGRAHSKLGDAVVAFGLPGPSEGDTPR